MNDSRKFIKIGTDNSVKVIEIPEESFVETCYDEIGCSFIDICTPCPDVGLQMIIDDCGKFNDQRLNPLATVLYNRPDIIFGNVIVGMVGINNDGEPDIVGLSDNFVDLVLCFLDSFGAKIL